MLVTNAKLKMREEFEQKKKELQVQMLMCVVALACVRTPVSACSHPESQLAARHPRALVSSGAASSSPATS